MPGSLDSTTHNAEEQDSSRKAQPQSSWAHYVPWRLSLAFILVATTVTLITIINDAGKMRPLVVIQDVSLDARDRLPKANVSLILQENSHAFSVTPLELQCVLREYGNATLFGRFTPSSNSWKETANMQHSFRLQITSATDDDEIENVAAFIWDSLATPLSPSLPVCVATFRLYFLRAIPYPHVEQVNLPKLAPFLRQDFNGSAMSNCDSTGVPLVKLAGLNLRELQLEWTLPSCVDSTAPMEFPLYLFLPSLSIRAVATDGRTAAVMYTEEFRGRWGSNSEQYHGTGDYAGQIQDSFDNRILLGIHGGHDAEWLLGPVLTISEIAELEIFVDGSLSFYETFLGKHHVFTSFDMPSHRNLEAHQQGDTNKVSKDDCVGWTEDTGTFRFVSCLDFDARDGIVILVNTTWYEQEQVTLSCIAGWNVTRNHTNDAEPPNIFRVNPERGTEVKAWIESQGFARVDKKWWGVDGEVAVTYIGDNSSTFDFNLNNIGSFLPFSSSLRGDWNSLNNSASLTSLTLLFDDAVRLENATGSMAFDLSTLYLNASISHAVPDDATPSKSVDQITLAMKFSETQVFTVENQLFVAQTKCTWNNISRWNSALEYRSVLEYTKKRQIAINMTDQVSNLQANANAEFPASFKLSTLAKYDTKLLSQKFLDEISDVSLSGGAQLSWGDDKLVGTKFHAKSSTLDARAAEVQSSFEWLGHRLWDLNATSKWDWNVSATMEGVHEVIIQILETESETNILVNLAVSTTKPNFVVDVTPVLLVIGDSCRFEGKVKMSIDTDDKTVTVLLNEERGLELQAVGDWTSEDGSLVLVVEEGAIVFEEVEWVAQPEISFAFNEKEKMHVLAGTALMPFLETQLDMNVSCRLQSDFFAIYIEDFLVENSTTSTILLDINGMLELGFVDPHNFENHVKLHGKHIGNYDPVLTEFSSRLILDNQKMGLELDEAVLVVGTERHIDSMCSMTADVDDNMTMAMQINSSAEANLQVEAAMQMNGFITPSFSIQSIEKTFATFRTKDIYVGWEDVVFFQFPLARPFVSAAPSAAPSIFPSTMPSRAPVPATVIRTTLKGVSVRLLGVAALNNVSRANFEQVTEEFYRNHYRSARSSSGTTRERALQEAPQVGYFDTEVVVLVDFVDSEGNTVVYDQTVITGEDDVDQGSLSLEELARELVVAALASNESKREYMAMLESKNEDFRGAGLQGVPTIPRAVDDDGGPDVSPIAWVLVAIVCAILVFAFCTLCACNIERFFPRSREDNEVDPLARDNRFADEYQPKRKRRFF